MTGNDFGELLSLSMDKIRSIADTKTVIGSPIEVSGNLTVIPISKVSMGIATGGLSLKRKKETSEKPRFGAGGGSGVNVTPIAFLVINAHGVYDLLPIGNPDDVDPIVKVADLIEKSPNIAMKLKGVFGKDRKGEQSQSSEN